MKNNNQKKGNKSELYEDTEKLKNKKKLPTIDSKVNVKSKKFWEIVYDNEGEELEKFIR